MTQIEPTNTNCLDGVRCPGCGNQDHFLITATVTARVTDDGAEAGGHYAAETDAGGRFA